jgi:putative transposase
VVREDWQARHTQPYSTDALDELARTTFRQVEHMLDEGMGSCVLRRSEARQLVTDALHYFDGQRYELGCYVVMPNHVHAIVRPTIAALERVLQSWKRHSARRINELNRIAGAMWQEESHDRIIRDEEHLWRTIQYIGQNPIRANLSAKEYRRWIRPEWVESGWRFEE